MFERRLTVDEDDVSRHSVENKLTKIVTAASNRCKQHGVQADTVRTTTDPRFNNRIDTDVASRTDETKRKQPIVALASTIERKISTG